MLSAEQKSKRQLQEKSDHDWHMVKLEEGVRLEIISCPVHTAIKFLNGFAKLCDDTRFTRTGAIPVDEAKLRALIERFEVSEPDLNSMSRILLMSPKEDQYVYGKKLLFALSHLGNLAATMRIMRQVVMESKHEPWKLNSSEIQEPRRHLKKTADRGQRFRAMTLQGKVDRALGNEEAAIQYWKNAVPAAVARAQEIAARQTTDESAAEVTDLDAPWTELTTIHIARHEFKEAKEAIKTGCDIDDPFSHFFAALFARRTNKETDEPEITSAWLYHMTKAAASDHPKAAHALGNFYSRSVWPFIEDEPPDEIKPTHFDRYPPKKEATQGLGSKVLGVLRRIVGLDAHQREEPALEIFRTASFPTNPVDRMAVALHWLQVAIAGSYAPSNLLAARLLLEKTVWAAARTPHEALYLLEERYKYASKADYEAGKPLRPEEEGNEDDGDDETVPNPFYDEELAKVHLREVFYADLAQRAQMQFKAENATLRRHGAKTQALDKTIHDEMLSEHGMRHLKPKVRTYFRFPLVRDMYSDDSRGLIFDDFGSEKEDIVEAARDICEERGWDLYDDDGELLYRHGMKS